MSIGVHTARPGLSRRVTRNRRAMAQRIPVYIALDSRELVEHPLPIGLSMTVEVDMHERGGARPLELALASSCVQETRDEDHRKIQDRN